MTLEHIGFYTLSDERARTASVISQMKRGSVTITEHCNYKCVYCKKLPKTIFKKEKMTPLQNIKNVIDLWCMNDIIENIQFTGGESTLHPALLDMVQYAKNKGVKRINIATNGSSDMNLYNELIESGVNDFSISLDSACAKASHKLTQTDDWYVVVNNIKNLVKKTYVTIGIVLVLDEPEKAMETINSVHGLGVSDMRVNSMSQTNNKITGIDAIDMKIRQAHPILNYRINRFMEEKSTRGLLQHDSNKCPLVLDDSTVAGNLHFPCVIYMREGGAPIGMVSAHMRQERMEWNIKHNTHNDPICKKYCLDFCKEYNNRSHELKAV